jgi:hypothetical protein
VLLALLHTTSERGPDLTPQSPKEVGAILPLSADPEPDNTCTSYPHAGLAPVRTRKPGSARSVRLVGPGPISQAPVEARGDDELWKVRGPVLCLRGHGVGGICSRSVYLSVRSRRTPLRGIAGTAY